MKSYKHLKPYCQTDRQMQVVDAVVEHGGQRAAARALNMDYKSVWRIIRSLEGKVEATDTSTLYKFEDEDGKKLLQWVKAKGDPAAAARAQEELLAALSDDLPRLTPMPAPVNPLTPDLANMYLITDYHLGMLAWGEETGADWDLDIAEEFLIKWFSLALSRSPDAQVGILAQLGDFLHFDGLEAVTPASKHILDSDTRWQKLIRTAVRVVRAVIDMMLTKHSHVHIIMAEGNHDEAISAALREWLPVLYENEPRVTVDSSADPYYSFSWGETALFFHHGHKVNIKRLDGVFVAKNKRMFGASERVYGHVGHYHTDEVLSTELMRLERHNTLAAPDAYASRNGYMGVRDAKVITYHKKFGEIGRQTISHEMVEYSHGSAK